jgi:hypothetical protein
MPLTSRYELGDVVYIAGVDDFVDEPTNEAFVVFCCHG